jgi:putative membrane protein
VEKTARLRVVGAVGSAAVIAFGLFVAKPGSTYRIAPLFLVPIVWLPCLFRRWLRLHPLHYVLFIVAILAHNLGAMGWYQKSPLPWSFDIYVHFYFGVVGGLLVYRMLQQSLPLRGWTLALMTVLLVLGAGAVHEEVEWFSTLLLGPERGMLKTPAQGVYIFDTQRDMFNDLTGSMLAVILYVLVQRGRRSAPEVTATAPAPGDAVGSI